MRPTETNLLATMSSSPARPGVTFRRGARATLVLLALAASVGPWRGTAHEMHEMAGMDSGDDEAPPSRSMREYAVPDVRLVRDDGKVVSLAQEMDDGRPIFLNFIFTTCTDICPLMSSVFEQFQQRLGEEAGKVHLMSISIDPEQDTPARLSEYARKFHAGREWQHYTGTREASIAAQRAFDVYRGGKMRHTAVTLVRVAPGKPWLRIEGFVKPDDLVHDYRHMLAAR
ncbi:MAG TPA: SCO family protein [Anaeromyxobacter sp.]|nr:SCO family protein [Anaeromyxobacter sp.]